MQLCAGLTIGLMRGFRSVEQSEKYASLFCSDFGTPPLGGLVPVCALQSRSAVAAKALVAHVLGLRNKPQVAAAIVQSIAIDVVNNAITRCRHYLSVKPNRFGLPIYSDATLHVKAAALWDGKPIPSIDNRNVIGVDNRFLPQRQGNVGDIARNADGTYGNNRHWQSILLLMSGMARAANACHPAPYHNLARIQLQTVESEAKS
jgi:hypothetical protein